MREELLHFIWNYRLLKLGDLVSVNGRKIRIIHPGELNRDSGPDFFNARLEVDGVILAGNVEIHVNASDWLKHHHQEDEAYNNLVLHAVYKYDKDIEQNTTHNVEVLELKNYLDADILKRYEGLVSSPYSLPCSKQIKNVNKIRFQSWLQRMQIERLENKTNYVKDLFRVTGNDYAQTIYILLARNFGFKVNNDAFELLAKHLPLNILLKHSGNLLQLEALLYGCAGFLDNRYEHEYLRQLQNEYEFLKQKYKLKALDASLWKFSRLMPANFPTVRIWQFAMLIHKSPGIFSKPWDFNSVKKLSESVSYMHEGYWRTHYKMDGPEIGPVKALGKNSIENIMVNTFAPFLFFYGKQTGEEKFCDAALICFEELLFENNHKTRHFTEAGLTFNTSGESQGLIQLFDNYCKNKQCLSCGAGSSILTKYD